MDTFVDLIVDLTKSMAVVIMVAYLFTRTRLYRDVLERRVGWQSRILLTLIFGAFSIWGTLSGVEILGGIANTRDLGPALGGLLGGPVVGVGAGLIGAAQRLTMGGFTAVPCALATVVAGFSGGVVYLILRGRIASVLVAMLLALFTESFHMGITLLLARPYDQAHELVGDVIVPMIVVNALGMGIFVFIVRNEQRERQTRAQKERMEGELKVARDIQLGIVPTIFPPFPERDEFDLHASLESAREVGGDLYDFFFVDDERLFLAIGDVSGKGVPASLFMAVTITLLRAVGHRLTAPDEILATVNANLCRGNDSAMFVTLFLASYEIATGELTYCSGGHPPGYIVRRGGDLGELPQAVADGGIEPLPQEVGGTVAEPLPRDAEGTVVEPLPQTAGAGLGVSERVRFETGTATLRPGDGLLLYSDGVTEAMGAEGGMFGAQRLEAALGAVGPDVGAEGMMTAVRAAVDAFTAGAEQYDDITMLALRRTPADT